MNSNIAVRTAERIAAAVAVCVAMVTFGCSAATAASAAGHVSSVSVLISVSYHSEGEDNTQWHYSPP